MATMKKQGFRLSVALMAFVVLLSMTAMADTGRYDQQIQQAVSHKFHDAKKLQAVNSSVEDGIVTLTGSVDLYQDKLDAAKKAKKVSHVTGVRNSIVVAGENVPDSQLQQKLATPGRESGNHGVIGCHSARARVFHHRRRRQHEFYQLAGHHCNHRPI